MKKLLAIIVALAFAFGLVGGTQMVKADGTNGNTNSGGGTDPGGNTNTGGGTNSCGANCKRITWGQLKVMYMDDAPDNKNAE